MKNQTREELKKEISQLKAKHKQELLKVKALATSQGAINMGALINQYIVETIGMIPKENTSELKAVKKTGDE